jgi:hypothetical protein
MSFSRISVHFNALQNSMRWFVTEFISHRKGRLFIASSLVLAWVGMIADLEFHIFAIRFRRVAIEPEKSTESN